nr:immunoglobulin light chain junction region [Macaca mulatta]
DYYWQVSDSSAVLF